MFNRGELYYFKLGGFLEIVGFDFCFFYRGKLRFERRFFLGIITGFVAGLVRYLGYCFFLGVFVGVCFLRGFLECFFCFGTFYIVFC